MTTSAQATVSAVPVDRAAAARSAKWSAVENGGLALISFVSLVVYARFLTVSEFGVFAVALALVELLTALTAMLFHDALVQRRDIRELHYDTAFAATLVLSVVLAAACWLVAPVIARRAQAPEAGPVLVWLSLCLPLTAWSATLVARRRRELQFRMLAMRSLAGRLAGAAAGIGLVVAGFGVWGLVVQQLAMVLLGSLVLWLQCADRPRLRFAAREFRELIGFALASVGALMVHFSLKRAFMVVCGVSLGTHGAGLLNLTFRAVDTFWSLAATTVSQIALPVLSSVRADAARFERAFDTASAFVCAVLYLAFVLLAAVSPEVVRLLFGPQWVGIAPWVTLLALLVLVQARRLLFAPMLTALGRPQDLLLAQGAELAFVALAIVAFGVPSVDWAVGLWMGRELLGSLLQAWMYRRASGAPVARLARGMGIPFVAALALFAAVHFGRTLLPPGLAPGPGLAALAFAGTAAYLAVMALLGRGLLAELAGFARAAFERRTGGAAGIAAGRTA